MNLLLDVGNTRIKWAIHLGSSTETFISSGDVVHAGRIAAALTELPAAIRASLDSGTKISRVFVVNVIGSELRRLFTDLCMREFHLEASFAESELECLGLTNGYADVSQLGADRWVGMLGAMDEGLVSFCVVDAGTAVTIDFVASGTSHMGGLILPGLALMRNALFLATGDIEELSMRGNGEQADDLLGRSTHSAVHLGPVQAVVGAVERTLNRQKQPVRLIVTGGDAKVLLPHLAGYSPEDRPLLVLEGLAKLAAIA